MTVQLLALPPKNSRSPSQCAQHEQPAAHMSKRTPALRIVYLAQPDQQINPIMRTILRACAPTDQDQLRMHRIINVRRQIDQADTRPPQSDRRAEIVEDHKA